MVLSFSIHQSQFSGRGGVEVDRFTGFTHGEEAIENKIRMVE